jgi:hypothetical protein
MCLSVQSSVLLCAPRCVAVSALLELPGCCLDVDFWMFHLLHLLHPLLLLLLLLLLLQGSPWLSGLWRGC